MRMFISPPPAIRLLSRRTHPVCLEVDLEGSYGCLKKEWRVQIAPNGINANEFSDARPAQEQLLSLLPKGRATVPASRRIH